MAGEVVGGPAVWASPAVSVPGLGAEACLWKERWTCPFRGGFCPGHPFSHNPARLAAPAPSKFSHPLSVICKSG